MAECNITTVPEYAGEALCTGDADAQRLAFCSYFSWVQDTFVPYINNTFVPKLGECIDWIGEQVTQVARDRDQVTEDRNFIASTLNAQYVGAWNATDDFFNKMVEYDGALWVGLLSAVGETPQRNDNWLFVNYISSYIEAFYILTSTEKLEFDTIISVDHIPQIVNSQDSITSMVWNIKKLDGTVVYSATTSVIGSIVLNKNIPLENKTEYKVEVIVQSETMSKSVFVQRSSIPNWYVSFDIFGDGSRQYLYQFDGDSSDLGGAYTGTDTDVSYSIGKIDECLNFNSRTSYVELGFPILVYADDWSIGFWSKWDGTDYNTNYAPLHLGDLALEWTDSNQYFTTLNASGTGKEKINADFPELHDNTWHFVTVTWKRSTTSLKLYIDGVDTQSSITTGGTFKRTASTLAGYIGSTSYTASSTGFLDNLSICNRELTATEVATLAQEGVA